MTETSESEDPVRAEARPAIRLLVMLIVAAVLVVGGVWIIDPPKFRAKGFIQVESPYPKPPLEIHPEIIPVEIMRRFVKDQAILAKDDSVLQATLTSSDVMSTAWYASQPDKLQILETLKSALRAEPVPGTTYVELSFVADNPMDAAIIVNTVLNKYVEHIQERALIECKTELMDYRDRETALSKDLENLLERKEKSLGEQLAAPGVTKGLDLNGEALKTLTAEVTRLEQEKLKAKAAYESLAGAGSADVSISPPVSWAIQQDPEVADLREMKLSLEIELESAATSQPESRPADDVLKRKLKVVERKLTELLMQKARETRNYQVDSARAKYQATIQQEAAIRERILELQTKQRDADQASVQFKNLDDRQLQLTRELDKIREFSNQLTLMIKDRGMIRVRPFPAMKSEARDIDFQVRTSMIALAIPIAYGLLLLCIRIIRGPRYERHPIEDSSRVREDVQSQQRDGDQDCH